MRWGLIGASTIADEWMIAAIRANGGEVVALASGAQKHAAQLAKKHGIAHVVNAGGDGNGLADLFAHNLDAVYISSINDRHRDQLRQAAAAGCHVLCEKPLAVNLADAKAMIVAAAEAGVKFATNHHLRFAATHQAIRERIDRGDIGEPRSARVFHAVALPPHLQGWRIDNPAAGGGVVLDIAVHNCDLLAFLLGEYPRAVASMSDAKTLGQGVEDDCMSVWRYPSGVLAYTHESFVTPHAGHGVEVHGNEGSLIGEQVMSQKAIGRVFLQRDGEREEIPTTPRNLYEAGIADFVKAIKTGGKPSCDGVAGTRSLAVALAVLESAAEGKVVEVDYGGFDA